MNNAEKGDTLSTASALARFFSSGVLAEFGATRQPSIATRLFRQLNLSSYFNPDMLVGHFYNALFSHLVRHYRFEYVYKNAIAEKKFWGCHNLTTAFMLTEFRVADCKADTVIVNGTSHVYEIKTEMDDFTRLDSQLAAYFKVFDYITLVTEEKLFSVAEQYLPENVGILTLADKRYQFRRQHYYRKPVSNKQNVDPLVLFDSLTRAEYLQIIKKELGVCLNKLPNTQIYTEARRLFASLPPVVAHDNMVRVLRERSNALSLRSVIDELPTSLQAAAFSLKMNAQQKERFISRLNSPLGVVLA